MSDEIKIIVQNKKRENKFEVKTKRPRTFEMLLKFINEKIKEMNKFYTIYISQKGKGIQIRNDEQYQIYRTKVIYILEKDMLDIAPTLVGKEEEVIFEETMNTMNNTMDEYSAIKNTENNNEINDKPKDINDKFIENISNILKKILIRFKEVDSLLPSYNEKLIELVNKFESNLATSQINNISDIILEELNIIENYIKSKNLPKIDLKRNPQSNFGLQNKVNTQPNLGIDIPISCIPRILKNSYEDISFEKIGKK